jgi:predicted nucleic acid-binding protein
VTADFSSLVTAASSGGNASVVVAALLDSGSAGQWATARMAGAELSAPTLLPYECANIIRRLEFSGAISADQAAQVHADMLDLPVDLWPYDLLATRAWGFAATCPPTTPRT